MKKYPLMWYYKSKICRLKRNIENTRLQHAKRSLMSRTNFEFDHYVEEDIKDYKKEIYSIKRKMCQIR